jgi:hypothetical protein
MRPTPPGRPWARSQLSHSHSRLVLQECRADDTWWWEHICLEPQGGSSSALAGFRCPAGVLGVQWRLQQRPGLRRTVAWLIQWVAEVATWARPLSSGRRWFTFCG